VIRILPQRIITPRSTTGVQSIWFQSKSEHPDFGVSLADVVGHGAEGLMVAPEERVFQTLGLDHDKIQFSILVSGWPVGTDSFANLHFTVARIWTHLLDRFYPHQHL